MNPVLQNPSNSQNYNRYSYCLNNPLKYVDPSGCKIFIIKKSNNCKIEIGHFKFIAMQEATKIFTI